MANIVRAVLCHRVITDTETNAVTLVDCVETLSPKKLPARLPRIILATLWERADASADGDATRARLVLRGPDPADAPIVERDLPVLEFKANQTRLRVNINLQGVHIARPGTHTVTIESSAFGDEWSAGSTNAFEVLSPELRLAAEAGNAQKP